MMEQSLLYISQFLLKQICTNKISMKVNFDEIWSSPVRRLNNSKASIFSQFYTNNTINQSFHVEPKINKVMYQTQQASKPSIMNAIHRHKKDQDNYKWYKEFKTNETTEKKQNNKPKPQKKVNIKKLTERLYDSSQKKKIQPNKSFAFEYSIKKLRQENLPLKTPRKKVQRVSTEGFEKGKKLQAHQRLYRNHLQRSFKAKEVQQKLKEKISYIEPNPQNEEYLKNYTNFYDRLDEEVYRKKMERIFLDQNPNFVLINQNHQLFQPDLSLSKRSLQLVNFKPTLKPKKQTDDSKSYSNLEKPNISFDKSTKIMQKNQDRLIKKIVSIFDCDGIFEVNPENIQLLQDFEFKIIFPLIQKLEGKKVSTEEFEKLFTTYYKKLPAKEKQQIRSNNIRRKKPQESQVQEKKVKKNLKMKTDRTFKPARKDYLKKIEQFV